MPSLSPLPQRFHSDGRECICRRCRNAGDYVHYTRVGLRAIGIEPQYRSPAPISPVTPVPSWETARYHYTTDEYLPQPVSNGQNDWRVVSTPLSYEPLSVALRLGLLTRPTFRVNPVDVEEWSTSYRGTTSLGDYDGDRRDPTSTTNQSDGTGEGEEECTSFDWRTPWW